MPPQAGASASRHVTSGLTQMQLPRAGDAPQICPGWGHVPPHAGTCEIAQVSAVEMHLQSNPPLRWPQVRPGRHVPPHAGAWEMSQVSFGLAQVQKFDPVACPQMPLPAHVPPHAGACAREHEPATAQKQRFAPLSWPHVRPGGHSPPHAGTPEISHVSFASTQMHEPFCSPQTWPLGQAPPQAGAWPIQQVFDASTQVQWPELPSYPHVWPLGQAPPHAGASEIRQVSSSATHPQDPPGVSAPQTSPSGHVPAPQFPRKPHPTLVVEVVEDVVTNADSTSETQASTLLSTASAPSEGAHPPLASARAHAALNFSSAFVRQDVSTGIA